MPDTLPVPEAVREGDTVALGERDPDSVADGDKLARTVATVAVTDMEGDRVALGERVADRVAETETLTVTEREKIVGVAGSVAKAVGSDPEAD